MSADVPEAGSPFRPADDSDVVMSCRVRLARNVVGFPFVGRATHPQRREILETVRAAAGSDEASVGLAGGRAAAAPPAHLAWLDMPTLPKRDRQILWERHLVSRQFAEGDSPRAVAVTTDERFSLMVNEEDHVRMQVLRPGNAMREAFDVAMGVDDALGSRLDFAFHPRLGYLTACPTNVGCGMRIGAMVHLRAMRVTNELEKVKRAAKELHLAVRGFHGEGTDATGDWFQISNQRTLGVTEHELLELVAGRILPLVVTWERESRARLLAQQRTLLEDRVFRGIALLRAARLLGLDEAMKQLSTVRMGACAGLLSGVSLETLARLTIQVQSAHLRAADPSIETDDDERAVRARVVREALAGTG
ncbi:MAG: ATP--guanido phosphotransferase [Phycisphaerales bacterium]|nr:ATP--guanido phosphotransferase [Phycisphaerales bacterium]